MTLTAKEMLAQLKTSGTGKSKIEAIAVLIDDHPTASAVQIIELAKTSEEAKAKGVNEGTILKMQEIMGIRPEKPAKAAKPGEPVKPATTAPHAASTGVFKGGMGSSSGDAAKDSHSPAPKHK